MGAEAEAKEDTGSSPGSTGRPRWQKNPQADGPKARVHGTSAKRNGGKVAAFKGRSRGVKEKQLGVVSFYQVNTRWGGVGQKMREDVYHRQTGGDIYVRSLLSTR